MQQNGQHFYITKWFLTMTENGLNPTFLIMKNYLQSDLTNSIFTPFINTVQGKLHSKLGKKLYIFEKQAKNMKNIKISRFSDLSDTLSTCNKRTKVSEANFLFLCLTLFQIKTQLSFFVTFLVRICTHTYII